MMWDNRIVVIYYVVDSLTTLYIAEQEHDEPCDLL